MRGQKIVAAVVGSTQLLLGSVLLIIPGRFFDMFGFTAAAADQNYLYAQLAARFLAYGIGMFEIGKNPSKYRLWWNLMILIQILDLAAGLVYTVFFGLPLGLTAFPMINAAVFVAIMLIWKPESEASTAHE